MKSCVSWYVKDEGTHTALVGMHYDTTTGVSHKFTYNSGTSNTLGVGFSYTGSYGSFKASGTHTRSAEGSAYFPTATTNEHDYTRFAWGLYGVACDGVVDGYQMRTRGWAGGGTYWTGPTAPSAPYCVTQAAGTGFSRNSSQQTTASTGADVSAAIGIDLSSQSGYSTGSSISYKFSSTRSLCGVNDYPGLTPGRLVAK